MVNQEQSTGDKKRCPVCNYVLQKRNEGLVCKNWKCKLFFKVGVGWVYLDGSIKNNIQYFKDKYEFDIEHFENKKKWLRKKSEILRIRGRECQICGSGICIHVHHILPRAENPNLTFDDENLMVLCLDCHKQIHKEDKHKFG